MQLVEGLTPGFLAEIMVAYVADVPMKEIRRRRRCRVKSPRRIFLRRISAERRVVGWLGLSAACRARSKCRSRG